MEHVRSGACGARDRANFPCMIDLSAPSIVMMASVTANDLILLREYSADGDAGAFAELVRRYADMVYATARRVTGDATAAEDVSQDCFLSLAQGSASIRGSLAAWLHRTSLNRSLELRRAERSRRRREAQAVVDHDSAPGAS